MSNNLYNNFPELRVEWKGNIEDMKKYTIGTDKKVNWKCKTGNPCHEWNAIISSRTNKNNPSGCPYCCGRETCSCENCPNLYNNFPELRVEWKGNIEDMKKYTIGSNTKVNWKCKTGNPCHEWDAIINSRTKKNNPTGCPYCCNKTEGKMWEFLESRFGLVEREKRFNWSGKRRYDFLVDNKTIVELDGPQHFIQISNWKSPEETKKIDIQKMQWARENDYYVIRIEQEDVYYDRNNWKQELLDAIENIEEREIVYIGSRYGSFMLT